MMPSKLYSTVYKSVVRATNDMVKEISATTGDQSARYWSWEARVDEEQLPRATLIGVNGFTLDENFGLWIIRFGITLSTVDDANLLHEADIIDIIHDWYGVRKKIDLRDPETGDPINELVSFDFQVLAMTQTQMRNYRSIGLELRRTGTDG